MQSLLNYGFAVFSNAEGENELQIYDKYGRTQFTTKVSDEIAAASEEDQINFIETTFNDVLETISNDTEETTNA